MPLYLMETPHRAEGLLHGAVGQGANPREVRAVASYRRSTRRLVAGVLLALLLPFPTWAQLSIQIGPTPGLPTPNPNTPVVSLYICDPTRTTCQTINSILVDTGSVGVRIFAQALSIQLPAQQVQGEPIAECYQVRSGVMRGLVKTASVSFPVGPTRAGGGEPPVTVPVQLVDPNVTLPCNGSALSLPGVNGVLGIAPLQFDTTTGASYFTCNNGSCTSADIAPAQTVQNPVYLLPTDNNGVIISMPAVPSAGAPTVSGVLYFGIGTSPVNDPQSISSHHPYVSFNRDSLDFSTTFNGTLFFPAVIDSGSNMLSFPDTSLPQCSSPVRLGKVYCPLPSPILLSATIAGATGPSQTVGFEVANGKDLIASGNLAFANLAMPPPAGPVTFIWGLPFFYNRAVFIAYGSTPLGNAPAWGYAYLNQPYDGVDITVKTGTDDAGSGTEITATFSVENESFPLCLKPTSSTGSWVDSVCNGSSAPNSWPNWNNVDNPKPLHFPAVFAQALATGSGTIDIALLQSSCSLSCDNWDLQGLIVTLTDSTNINPPKTLINVLNTPHAGDNCIARLKGPPNARKVRFMLDGTNTSIYLDGTSSEQGQRTTCKNNGDN